MSFNPYLPHDWEGYCFKITYRGRVIRIIVEHEDTSYELLQGDLLTLLHAGQTILLEVGSPIHFPGGTPGRKPEKALVPTQSPVDEHHEEAPSG